MRICLTLLLVVLASFAAPARAGAALCVAPDVLQFGNRTTGSAITQSSQVRNCGDMPLTFTGIDVHPATSAAFHPTSTCLVGQTLAVGATCAVDVTFVPLSPGQVSGGLWLRTTAPADTLVTFYGRGVDARVGITTLTFTPPQLSFGAQVVGATSVLQTVTLRNLGPGALTLTALVLNGPHALDFRAPGNCLLGVPILAGGSCELYFAFTPRGTGARTARLNVDAPELAELALMQIDGLGVATAATGVDVVEFYNAPLNHYFLTAVAEEAAVIDAGGVGPDWRRTGHVFRAYAADSPEGRDVCRFFGTPGIGPSAHFYTADPAECALVKRNPHWLYEGIAFRSLLPALGQCPGHTAPVLRFFLPGADVLQSRHRYVVDAGEIARMRGTAWIEEGPVFCSPL